MKDDWNYLTMYFSVYMTAEQPVDFYHYNTVNTKILFALEVKRCTLH